MKSIQQYLNEELVLELSSDLLSRASRKARELGRTAQSNRFAVAAGKALEKELKSGNYKKGTCQQIQALQKVATSSPAGKAAVKNSPETTTIKFPKLKVVGNVKDPYKEGFDHFEFEGWKDVKIPKGKFYIYQDNYHNTLHIGTLGDFTGLIASDFYDYEDFDASYIKGAYPSLKDAVKAAIKIGKKKFYDSEDFMNNVMDGEITDDDYYDFTTWEGGILDALIEFSGCKVEGYED